MFFSKHKMWAQEEIADFNDLISALKRYRPKCLSELNQLAEKGIRTPEEIEQIRQAINVNSDLFEYMAHKAPKTFDATQPIRLFETRYGDTFTTMDLHQVTSALKSAARDWTEIGAKERQSTYTPIIEAIKEFIPVNSKILIPGAGLCRLAVEIASAGYIVTANENSFIMIVISQIAFRHKKEFRIFPFLHQISGLETFNDTMISAIFPRYLARDTIPNPEEEENTTLIEPTILIQAQRLILMAGGIEGMETAPSESYDGIVTCFFIDVVSDLEKVIALFYRLLKPGCYWINLGPLLMHRSDDDFFPSYTFTDIPKIANKIGYTIIRDTRLDTTYTENPNTNIRTNFTCQLLIAQK